MQPDIKQTFLRSGEADSRHNGRSICKAASEGDHMGLEGATLERAKSLFEESQAQIHQRADHLFAKLMVLQWLAGIGAALWISPKTWIGAASQVHWHVWAAIFLGGAITSLPVFLAWSQPGRPVTRHVIAIAQMLTSALLIHLTGGRIETHFHVFGSLAFLAFYRDWRVLLTATVVVAVDHMGRGIFWPQSVFGVLITSPWRWLEHAGWVAFEDLFLFISIRQGLNDMWEVAARRARLESSNTELRSAISERERAEEQIRAAQANLERRVEERTSELRQSQLRTAAIVDSALDCIITIDSQGRITEFNPSAEKAFGHSRSDILGEEMASLIVPQRLREEHRRGMARYLGSGEARVLGKRIEVMALRADGTEFPIDLALTSESVEGERYFTAFIRDLTEQKKAEAELAATQKNLIEASRQAGKAEVATGVLHNVGNVLNSVNVASSWLAESMRKSKAANLGKVASLMREHEADIGAFLSSDPKGKQLPGYLAQLSEHLVAEQAAAVKELNQLQKNVEHIKDIVNMQQSFAKVSGVAETVDAAELVEDALRMNASSLARHDIQIIKEIQELPPFITQKHKVLQILVNLIRNAKNACDESGRPEKLLTIRVSKAGGPPSADRIEISVSDNGVGVPAENLTRIFSHGFTTKKDGHGFGLHSGVLAARELGGDLRVHSEGPRQGATFTLELPLAPAQAQPNQVKEMANIAA